MDTATDADKVAALTALKSRRAANKTLVRVDNTKLRAGDPMYFYCFGCGAEIVVPEDYLDKPDHCPECTLLQKLGLLPK